MIYPIKAPTGSTLTCKGWLQEAAMRMLMNNLDPEVAEDPKNLVVYGGRGKAVRHWQAYEDIILNLKNLENTQTLLIQSGKPVGIINTHEDAPRVLIANSNLVGKWANWEHFDELEKKGLMMYGQMTAGSWIYIGSQGILQGTYETFAQAARTHFKTDGSLSGKIILTAGLGGMGGAQPLAVTMCGGVALCVEVDESRIEKRLETKYLDTVAASLEEAIQICEIAKKENKPLSVGLLGNAAEVYEKLLELNFKPDLITDQTSAHDPKLGYIPAEFNLEQAKKLKLLE